jgi:hypothetical protein
VRHGAKSIRQTPLLRSDAFHGLAGEIVAAIEPHTEADPRALLIQFLVAFGFVVGRRAFFLADGSRHFPNLFVVVVGETSKSRKGTAWSRIRSVFESMPTWPSERVMNGLSSGEGLIAQVSDSAADKRLLVVQTEFGSVLQVMARSGNTLSPTLRDAWDGTDLRVMTKNDPLSASGEHIAMIGQITSDELVHRVEMTELWNGFANRFLWCVASRSRLLPHGGDLADSIMSPLIRRLERVTKWAERLNERRITWDSTAAERWERVYANLAEAAPGIVGVVTSRAEAQVVRLALIYALLDKSKEIRAEHLKAALAVWDYCEASARNIFGDALGDPTADEILTTLRRSPEGMSRTDISNHFKRHRSQAEIDNALALLESRGLARKQVIETRGRPVERWSEAKQAQKAN